MPTGRYWGTRITPELVFAERNSEKQRGLCERRGLRECACPPQPVLKLVNRASQSGPRALPRENRHRVRGEGCRLQFGDSDWRPQENGFSRLHRAAAFEN